MLTILMGKSGAGKDTIQGSLVKWDFEPIVTATTRPIRDGERNGIDYHFMSKKDFINGIHAGQFIEYRSYYTHVDGKPDIWYYGTPKQELDKDKDYVIVVDTQGAKAFIDYYGRDNCFVVYLDVPDEIREKRAMQRSSFNKTDWNIRVKEDEKKFSKKIIDSIANYTVENICSPELVRFDIVEALYAYKAHEKEAGKHYYVEAENISDFDSPPEYVYIVHERNNMTRMKDTSFRTFTIIGASPGKNSKARSVQQMELF